MPYTNQDNLEDYLGTALDGDFAESLLSIWLGSIDEYIDRATGRTFSKDTTDQTKFYDGRQEAILYIDDLASLTSIVAKTWDFTATEHTLIASDYILLPLNKHADEPYTSITTAPNGFYAYWPSGVKRIEVTGKYGWPKVPKQITLAATLLAAGLYEERHQANKEVSELRLNDYTVRYDKLDRLSRKFNVDDLLASFKRHSYV